MSGQKEKVGKKLIIIIIAVLVVLVAALIICIVMLLSKQNEMPVQELETAGNSANSALLDRGFINEENSEKIMEEMSEKVSEGMFECKMTTTWTFDDGKSSAPNAYVANVENNLHTLYFDVYEETTNELLYSSPMLPVGTEIKNFKLDKELSAGEYDAVVIYTMVDDDLEEVSSVGFKVTIYVNN